VTVVVVVVVGVVEVCEGSLAGRKEFIMKTTTENNGDGWKYREMEGSRGGGQKKGSLDGREEGRGKRGNCHAPSSLSMRLILFLFLFAMVR
jgi:hypothetical protein